MDRDDAAQFLLLINARFDVDQTPRFAHATHGRATLLYVSRDTLPCTTIAKGASLVSELACSRWRVPGAWSHEPNCAKIGMRIANTNMGAHSTNGQAMPRALGSRECPPQRLGRPRRLRSSADASSRLRQRAVRRHTLGANCAPLVLYLMFVIGR